MTSSDDVIPATILERGSYFPLSSSLLTEKMKQVRSLYLLRVLHGETQAEKKSVRPEKRHAKRQTSVLPRVKPSVPAKPPVWRVRRLKRSVLQQQAHTCSCTLSAPLGINA